MKGATPKVLSTSKLTRDRVRSPAGETLGTIEDFVIDLATGRIAYTVLKVGGKLGHGKLFAIPWEALTLDPESNELVLDIAKETLENAPGFDRERWPDMSDPRWDACVQSFTPYWQKPVENALEKRL